MDNRILWSIDNELDGYTFERLCTDLLWREGYRDIVPVGGPRDHGRDAEIRLFRGNHRGLGAIFFQYSLSKNWHQKLWTEQASIKALGHSISAFVFVKSRKVTGERRDALRERAKAEFGWSLEIYEREWLRHRLEEVHPDLAKRYFTEIPRSKTFEDGIDYADGIDYSMELAVHPALVGRRWLLDIIKSWRSTPEAPRYFLLIGGPGVGKSALVAELVRSEQHSGLWPVFHMLRRFDPFRRPIVTPVARREGPVFEAD